MGETLNVRIETIGGLDRPAYHVDDLAALTASISKHGVTKPVLLRVDATTEPTGRLMLIKGLRRIRAAQSLGHVEVPAFVTNSFHEALEWMPNIYDTSDELVRPYSRRWLDLVPVDAQLSVLGMVFMSGMRRQHMLKKRRGSGGSFGGEWRPLVRDQMNVPDNTLRQLHRIQNWLSDPNVGANPMFQQLFTAFAAGEMLPSAFVYRVRRRVMLGPVVKATEQAEIVDTVVASMRGTFKSLRELGPLSPNLTQAQLETWASEFREYSVVFRTLSRNMEKMLND